MISYGLTHKQCDKSGLVYIWIIQGFFETSGPFSVEEIAQTLLRLKLVSRNKAQRYQSSRYQATGSGWVWPFIIF